MLVYFGLFGFLLLGSISPVIENDTESGTSDFYVENSAVSWVKSDYVNFTGPPIHYVLDRYYRIYINDADPNYNWSKTASDNAWLTGSGTEGDPYIIENLYINAEGIGGGIFITNTNRSFIIRDNWFDNSGPNEFDVGVLLARTGNGIIDNNIFTYVHRGVEIHLLSFNNMVSNNYMISNLTAAGFGRGIHISSNNNTLYNNMIKNFYDAIYIGQANNVIVDSNYAENTIHEDWDGSPIILTLCNSSSVIKNTLAGVWAFSSFNVSEDDSSGNTITNNTVVPGDTIVFGPNMSAPQLQQGGNGIRLEKSHHNLIAHNIMLEAISEGPEDDPNDNPNEVGGTIWGLDPLILIGSFGVMSVILIIIRRRR